MDDRYHRQTLIAWWDQRRVAAARVLVVGAGALGNEILKLLALTGVGRTLVYDPDVIERSNLSRSVLFRDQDEGRAKAEVAAARMRELNPEIRVEARVENVVTHAGLGVFLWADVIIGAVDNREARVFVSSACARAGKVWVDGAIEGLSGVVRSFDPRNGPCYECTMNATDRQLLAERRSCALLARDVAARGHVATTAVTASAVAALQVTQALKHLHGQPVLLGEGLYLDALLDEVRRVAYPRREACPGHDHAGTAKPLGAGADTITVGELVARAERELGPGATIDLSRDVVVALTCPACGARQAPGRAALGAVRERDAACPACGVHRVVDTAASLDGRAELDPAWTLADLGVPPYDALVARRGLERQEAWLLDADAPRVLGALEDRDRVSQPRSAPT
jgi:molybdopterin/thiamine biosynthesis adenylyltransferase